MKDYDATEQAYQNGFFRGYELAIEEMSTMLRKEETIAKGWPLEILLISSSDLELVAKTLLNSRHKNARKMIEPKEEQASAMKVYAECLEAENKILREKRMIILPARSGGKTRFFVKRVNAVRAAARRELVERLKKKYSQADILAPPKDRSTDGNGT